MLFNHLSPSNKWTQLHVKYGLSIPGNYLSKKSPHHYQIPSEMVMGDQFAKGTLLVPWIEMPFPHVHAQVTYLLPKHGELLERSVAEQTV